LTTETLPTGDIKIFRPAPGSLTVIRNRIIKRQGSMYLLALTLLLAYGFFFLGQRWYQVLFSLPILVTAGGVGLLLSYRQQRKIWESVEILLGHNFIGRRQLGIAEIRIQGGEIERVQDSDIGLLIFTASKLRSLIVPAELTEQDSKEIRTTLSAWKPIEPKTEGRNWKNIGLGALLLVIYGILAFPVTESPWVILIAFVAALGINGYYISLINRAQGIDPRQRLMFTISMVLILFIGLMRLCLVSGAYQLMMPSA
jgi:hypothetical protein